MVTASARTLVLDDDLEPIGVMSWHRALCLWYSDKQTKLNRVRVVAQYRKAKIRVSKLEDGEIQSAWYPLSRPAVVRIFGLRDRKIDSTLGFSRRNLYLRDHRQCQYCGVSLKLAEMTVDHVLPRAKGGATDWENVVAACGSCNQKKADSLLDEISMSLIQQPYIPKQSDIKPAFFKKSNAPLLWHRYLPA